MKLAQKNQTYYSDNLNKKSKKKNNVAIYFIFYKILTE